LADFSGWTASGAAAYEESPVFSSRSDPPSVEGAGMGEESSLPVSPTSSTGPDAWSQAPAGTGAPSPGAALPGERGSVGHLSSRGWGSLAETAGLALDGTSLAPDYVGCGPPGSVSCLSLAVDILFLPLHLRHDQVSK